MLDFSGVVSHRSVITVRKRSCGKVMFLHLSVILFTRGVGVCVSEHALGRRGLPLVPEGLPDAPLGRQPPPKTATAVDGTHPTGMHSCSQAVRTSCVQTK